MDRHSIPRAVGAVLDSKPVNRTGNFQFLVGAALLIWGVIKSFAREGVDPLSIVLIALGVLVLIVAVRSSVSRKGVAPSVPAAARSSKPPLTPDEPDRAAARFAGRAVQQTVDGMLRASDERASERMAREPAEPPEHVQALRERAGQIRRDVLLQPLGNGPLDRMFAAHFPKTVDQLCEARERRKVSLALQGAFRRFITTTAILEFPQDDGWSGEAIGRNTVWLLIEAEREPADVPLEVLNDGYMVTWSGTVVSRYHGDGEARRRALRDWLQFVARSDAAAAWRESAMAARDAHNALAESLYLIEQRQIWKEEACEVCAGTD